LAGNSSRHPENTTSNGNADEDGDRVDEAHLPR
jgi:hypothetical protein